MDNQAVPGKLMIFHLNKLNKINYDLPWMMWSINLVVCFPNMIRKKKLTLEDLEPDDFLTRLSNSWPLAGDCCDIEPSHGWTRLKETAGFSTLSLETSRDIVELMIGYWLLLWWW